MASGPPMNSCVIERDGESLEDAMISAPTVESVVSLNRPINPDARSVRP